MFPIPGGSLELKCEGKRFTPVKVGGRIERYEHIFNQYAVLNAYGRTFVVTARSAGPLSFKATGIDQIQYADNSLALWSKIKDVIDHPKKYETVREDQEMMAEIRKGQK